MWPCLFWPLLYVNKDINPDSAVQNLTPGLMVQQYASAGSAGVPVSCSAWLMIITVLS
jgi:hypothetical protein